ncbi:hypothetical protein JOM56_000635 [Amanita muscaria]
MAARFDAPELDGTLLTARAMEDAEKLARACRVLGTELGGCATGGAPTEGSLRLGIIPATVVARWTDEVLAGGVWGATFFVDKGGVERKPGQDGMEAEIGHGEATVKDVLVQRV